MSRRAERQLHVQNLKGLGISSREPKCLTATSDKSIVRALVRGTNGTRHEILNAVTSTVGGTMSDRTRRRARFWVEVGLAVLATALMVLTLISREWIEWLTGTDPDGGSGSLEWSIVAVCFLAAAASATLARREWQRVPVTA